MPDLRLLQGTLAALEGAFADAVVHARSPDPLAPVTVLVGQSLLKRYLPRMLAQRGIGHINVRFIMPDELARDLAGDAASNMGRTSRAAERLLVRLVAADSPPSGYFGAIARGEGFADAMLRLIRELERGNFSPDTLAATLDQGGLSGARFTEIVALYRAYLRRREDAGLAGASDFYTKADANAFEGTLLICGLWEATAAQFRLIEQVATQHDVAVFLPLSGLDADDTCAALRVRLMGLGAAVEGLVPEDEGTPRRVAATVFREPATPLETDAVWLVSAPDTVREVWEMARACVRWAGEGIAFHEMAVVYRNRDPYRELCAEIFTEAGIPLYMHDGNPLSAHPLGRRLLALLELVADDAFSRQRVMAFLTETLLPKQTKQRHQRFRSSEWEGYTRDAGVVAGIEQWRSRLQRLGGEKREHAAKAEGFEWLADQATRVDDLLAFVEELHAALQQRPASASWAEHLAFVRDLAANYADGLEPLLKALDDLAMLSAIAPEISFGGFLRAVRDDLDARDTTAVLGEPEREFGKQGVAVVDVSSLRHLRFRAVYMVGMAERAWPAPKRPDPLLLEHERVRLNAAALDSGLPLRTSPDDEALSFLIGMQAAHEQLVVSYARAEAGSSGRRLPSYFFRALAQAIEGREVELSDIEAIKCVRRFGAGRLAHDPIGESVTAAEYDRGLIAAAIGEKRAGVVEALAAFDAADAVRTGGAIARAVAARRERWSDRLTAYDGVMSSDAAVARAASMEFARARPVSPSRLEMYAECPYRYFMRYGLNIEPVEEPEAIDRMDHLERGSLIHGVLDRFLKALDRKDPPSRESREQHLELLLKIAQEEADDRERRGVTGRPLLWAIDRRQILEDLVRWYDKEVDDGEYTTLRPGAFEAGFGGVTYGYSDDDDPLTSVEPLRLTVGGREMLLQGRIDRVDWDDAKTRFRVIDYKTGKARDKAAFDGGKALQLPLYLHAAAQLLQIAPDQGEAQYFYCTRRGEYKRKVITGFEIMRRREELEQVLATIAEGVDTGTFTPNPGKGCQNCRFCDYRDVCDTRIDRIADRKAGDPRGAAFIAMKDIV